MKKTNSMESNITSWNKVIACQEFDKDLRLDTSLINTSANCFIYAYIYSGKCEFSYLDKRITLCAGEIMVFSPIMTPTNITMTDDYHAIGLIVHQDFANKHVSARRNYHLFIAAIALHQIPKTKPSEIEFKMIGETLRAMQYRMRHPNETTGSALSALYLVFLCDITTSMEKESEPIPSNRNTNIFLDFIDLLNQNYHKHHNIGFYASNLNISSRYLSMIVKELTGFTVMYYINNRLALEACWLLRTTEYSIQQISDKLYFSDQASFCKFFKRMKGKKPIQYRNEKEK